MRERVLLLCVGLLMALACAACAPEESQPEENAYQLYFREKDLTASSGGDVFQTEPAELEEGLDTQEMVEALLEGLLAGPRSELLRGTLPAST